MFVFVGERPSQLAWRIGATWQSAQLAGRTLHDALVAAGLDPAAQQYCNLWRGPRPNRWDRAHERATILALRTYTAESYTVVGMGLRVQRCLNTYNVTHLALVHPAARGLIRKRERYHMHVRQVLLEAQEELLAVNS